MRFLPLILGCTEPACSEFVCCHIAHQALSCACQVTAHRVWGHSCSLRMSCMALLPHSRTLHLLLYSKESWRMLSGLFVLYFHFHYGKLDNVHEHCSKHLLMQLDISYTRGCCLWVILLMKNFSCKKLGLLNSTATQIYVERRKKVQIYVIFKFAVN